MSGLHLVDGGTIQEYIERDPQLIMNVVESAYKAHWERQSVCPHSLFLKFPSGNRIIALPAYLGNGTTSAAGMKWISSFPGNIQQGVPRASALVVLNDLETGFPIAVMEGAAISAARTGAFAALAFNRLLPSMRRARIAVVGCGRIASTTLKYISAVTEIGALKVFDAAPEHAQRFLAEMPQGNIELHNAETLEKCLTDVDVALFTTTASVPYVDNGALLNNCRLVLHVSLRDICEDVIGACYNVTDDREHVLRENTSLHRLATARPEINAVDAELGDIIWGAAKPPNNRTIAFSPFGLGVLDIALASHILRGAVEDAATTHVGDFFRN